MYHFGNIVLLALASSLHPISRTELSVRVLASEDLSIAVSCFNTAAREGVDRTIPAQTI
jgi:hypothetical protein